MADRRHVHGADYEQMGADYLHQRQLKSGAAGWVLLAGLGVAYVISGDFAGWNFGLAEGGWGGLLIATVLMAIMYTAMVFGLAELASALPVAGAGYGFARRAMGPLAGFATGTAILIEYVIAPAAIVVFIGGYVEALGLFGLTSGWPVYLVCYAIFVGIHLYGVGEALKLMFGITAIAVVALAVFVIGMIPQFSASNLFDIEPTAPRAPATSSRSASPGCWPPSSTASGSSWPSKASRWPPRSRATRSGTCPAGSSRR
ncbi:amino acid permease [Blastococcus brunescens]|uniref:Amino acid permease n=1 Tax=Blastococcus brunescens TaxID=1564165 RepID=A0ABZ1AZJ8_9ACTN|nr:amino acid permease [Blastococcus sp. BMG 8361]WRL62230.1 amino acid permease [Blastococcus sp. BMG 8361]